MDAPRWTYRRRIDFRTASVRHLPQIGGGQSRSSQHAHDSMVRLHTVHFKIAGPVVMRSFSLRPLRPDTSEKRIRIRLLTITIAATMAGACGATNPTESSQPS